MSSVLMQFTPLPQNAARLEKPHALAAKLRAILGDKVIKDWKWLQTTIERTNCTRCARNVSTPACRRYLTRGSMYRL